MLSGDGRRRRRPRRGTWPAATTVVVGVIGDPVEHSLSPALHNAAFAELVLDWAYVAFPVPPGRARAAVAAMADLGIRGLSVTMPHKAGAFLACQRVSPVAERLGVVNTVSNVGGELVGDSTDGAGFVDSLADLGWSPAAKRCLVLGTGGAARAVVLALAEAGAARVDVVGRRDDQVRATVALAGKLGAVGDVGAAGGADLIVNATPVGMVGAGAETGGLPFGLDPDLLGTGQLVADLVYAPATTPLLVAARARGSSTCNGLGMLIHQAARQVSIWTGRDAPVQAMSAAALAELGQRAGLGRLAGLPGVGEPAPPT
jgi:shikimate dehydrogenase